MVFDESDLEIKLTEASEEGYEGLMCIQEDYKWKDSKSRTVDIVKYKKRPTADLICIGVKNGKGKYDNEVGSLLLEDSHGRSVNVGSGLSDTQRSTPASLFIGTVWEIEYERTTATSYIQPTIVRIRDDKTAEELD